MWVTPLAAQKIRTQPHPSAELAGYTAFDFEEQVRGVTDPFGQYPQAEQWVREALEQQLAAQGLRAAQLQPAGLRIRFSARTEQKQRQLDTGRPYDHFVEQFVEATLSVEFIDSASGQVVWTGTATDSADIKRDGIKITADKARQKIRRAVRKLMQRFRKESGG